MARFYFDIDDGRQKAFNEEGVDLLDLEAAREAAIGVLPNIARDELPNGLSRDFIATVRDGSGKTVFRAALLLRAEYVET